MFFAFDSFGERTFCNHYIGAYKTSSVSDKDQFELSAIADRMVEVGLVPTSHLVCALTGEPFYNKYNNSETLLQGRVPSKGSVGNTLNVEQIIYVHCMRVMQKHYSAFVSSLSLHVMSGQRRDVLRAVNQVPRILVKQVSMFVTLQWVAMISSAAQL